MAGMGQKRRSFKTVSCSHLLTINFNESMIFRSKMGQTKHKPLRMRYFPRFSAGNRGLHLGHVFVENKYKE